MKKRTWRNLKWHEPASSKLKRLWTLRKNVLNSKTRYVSTKVAQGGKFEKAVMIDMVTQSCSTIFVLVASTWPRLIAITLHSLSIFFQGGGDFLWTLLLLLPNSRTFCLLLQTGVLCLVVFNACLCALVFVVVVVTIMRSDDGSYLLWVYLRFVVAARIWRSSTQMRRTFVCPLINYGTSSSSFSSSSLSPN